MARKTSKATEADIVDMADRADRTDLEILYENSTRLRDTELARTRAKNPELDALYLHKEATDLEEMAIEVYRGAIASPETEMSTRVQAAKALAAIAKDKRTRASKMSDDKPARPQSFKTGQVPALKPKSRKNGDDNSEASKRNTDTPPATV